MKTRPFVMKSVVDQNERLFVRLSNLIRLTLDIRVPGVSTLIAFVLPGPLLVIALLVATVLVAPLIPTILWEPISELADSRITRGIFVGALTVFAGLFYLARTFMRPVFGFAEVIVGATTCWSGLSNPSASTLLGGLAVVGGVYIIVGGLDNIIDDESLIVRYTAGPDPDGGQ